jgi:hypothetical protein
MPHANSNTARPHPKPGPDPANRLLRAFAFDPSLATELQNLDVSEVVKRLGYGEMPLKSLVAALGQQTDGRVLQLDETWSNGKCPGKWKNGLTAGKLAKDSFQGGAAGRKLYMEYTLKDA